MPDAHRIFPRFSRHDTRKPALFMRRLPDAAGRGAGVAVVERARTDVGEPGAGPCRYWACARGDRVALLSENRYEWAITDLATLGQGAVTVPIYPTLHRTAEPAHPRELRGARRASSRTRRSSRRCWRSPTRCRGSPRIVRHGPAARCATPRVRPRAALLADGERRRAAEPDAFRAPGRRHAAGRPRHHHLHLGHDRRAQGRDAHARQHRLQRRGLPRRSWSLSPPTRACRSCRSATSSSAWPGSTPCSPPAPRSPTRAACETVAADAQEVRPTILSGVPRFYEKVYARVMENAGDQPPLRRAHLPLGLGVGPAGARAALRGQDRRTAGSASSPTIADRLVGAKVRERVGGRIRYCISGGRRSAPKVMEFFFAIGIPILEGYGLTETSPVICLTVPGRERPGAVGPAGARRRGALRRRGRDPHARPGRHAGLLPERRGHARGDARRLVPHRRRRATWTTRASCASPTGSRTCSSPRAARRWRRSRSRRSSRRSRWVSEAVHARRPAPVLRGAASSPTSPTSRPRRRRRAGRRLAPRTAAGSPGVRSLYQGVIDELNAGLAPFETIKQFRVAGPRPERRGRRTHAHAQGAAQDRVADVRAISSRACTRSPADRGLSVRRTLTA